MKILDTVGIDVSKLTFDVKIHSSQSYSQFENSKKGFKQLLNWTYKNSNFSKENILFVFEHTGLYSHQISMFFTEKEISFTMVSGLEIKRSLGLSRGKDDKVDAKNIAKYAYRLRDEIRPSKLPSEQIQTLKNLLSLREKLVKQRAGYKTSFTEQKRVLRKEKNNILLKTQEKMIEYLSEQIFLIDSELDNIIKDDNELLEQLNLIISIKGVGKQTALFLIAFTNGFTKFKNWRKFASYSGIAPFPYQSGTSINGKTKVSHLANKRVKSLLDLCAKSAIQYNSEMKQYYNKRIDEGKNKMSTINIIRNKLLARIFAVVERKTPYVDFLKYAA